MARDRVEKRPRSPPAASDIPQPVRRQRTFGQEAEQDRRCQHTQLRPERFGTASAVHLGAAPPNRPPPAAPQPFTLLRGTLSAALTDYLVDDGCVRQLLASDPDDCSPGAVSRAMLSMTRISIEMAAFSIENSTEKRPFQPKFAVLSD